MDDLILSEKVLNQQVCTNCLNYLSVGPVMVSCRGKILCGRCSPSKLSELEIWNHSLYNLIAEKLVFKCINHYEGCEELLFFNEAVEHEKNCKKEGFKCLFCDYKGNGCQLVHHCDQKHPQYVVKDTFKIIFKEIISKKLIFFKENNIFCLNFSIKDTFIEFSNLQMSPAHLGPKHFKLRFFKSDTNIEFVTPIQIIRKLGNFPSSTSLLVESGGNGTNSNQIKNSSILDQMSLLECFPSGWCLCKTELIENYNCIEEQVLKIYLEKIKIKIGTKLPTDIVETRVGKKVNEGDFDINRVLKLSLPNLRKFVNNELQLMQFCVNCKKYITTHVYFCPKYHMACGRCSDNKCATCGIFCQWSLRPKFNIPLPCDRIGCDSRPNIFNYMMHKRDCAMRQYRCPDVECEFEGSLVELKKHWHVNPFFYSKELFLNCKNQSIFWHVSNEIFQVSIERCIGKVFVSINDVDVVLHLSYNFSLTGYGRDMTTGRRQHFNENIFQKEGNNVAKFDRPTISNWHVLKLLCSLK